jgi:YVTN family beta-propeller protein
VYFTYNVYYDGAVSVINTSADTISATITVGHDPTGICVSPDGSKVYVTNWNNDSTGTLSVINTATNTVSATIPVGNGPTGVSVSPDGSKVYVTNSDSVGTISVINTVTNTVSATITVGYYPEAVGNFISTHIPAGIPSLSIDASSISIYPNPATNQLTIHTSSFQNEALTVSVMNVLGETMQEEKIKWSSDIRVNIKNLAAGIYFLEMKSENGSVVKRFVKE